MRFERLGVMLLFTYPLTSHLMGPPQIFNLWGEVKNINNVR